MLKGNNFSLNGGTIRFFGEAGDHGDGTRWRISFYSPNPESAVDPSDSMPVIRQLIAGDVANGRGDDLAMIITTPSGGVLLYLEGVITEQQLNNAQEPTDSIVDVPGVFIDGRTLTVRVDKNATHNMATADAQGQIIA